MDRENSGRPVPPQRVATSSAAIDTAVSDGLRPPRSSPTGERRRVSSAGGTPAARSRERRSACVRREPRAPTKASGLDNASVSTGMSNFGSCVSTTTAVLSSVWVDAR